MPPNMNELERCAELLDASGSFRVLRSLSRRAEYTAGTPGSVATALAVDVETTGLQFGTDRIIQLCAIPFDFCKVSGQVFRVHDAVMFYEDPGRPIPSAITELTGITDAMVAGKRIDDAAVGRAVGGAALVIAHNASFDRPFIEQRLPAFIPKYWACSQLEVPWKRFRLRSSSLEFLLMHHCGMYYDAHSAEADCRAVIHLLAERLDGDRPAMALLLESARKRSVRLWAVESPFEKKDALRARGYRWRPAEGGRPGCWYVDRAQDERAAECDWLRAEVYGTGGQWREQEMDGRVRYSARAN